MTEPRRKPRQGTPAEQETYEREAAAYEAIHRRLRALAQQRPGIRDIPLVAAKRCPFNPVEDPCQ